MKYKVGDKVKIKSIDWYNENKDRYGFVNCNGISFTDSMKEHCGKVVTISKVISVGYYLKEEDVKFCFTDDMIEGLVEEEIITINTTNGLKFKELNISLESEMEWNLPRGYQFKDENGNVINATKIVLEKIKKEYPKTYEECAKIMNCPITGPSGWLFNFDANTKDPYYRKIDILMGKFTRLLICRDAYWKIAGEEMRLGKSWEPDWKKHDKKYIISVFNDTVIYFENETYNSNTLLAFPTAEMRDAFYENFKDLIEQCKELLQWG